MSMIRQKDSYDADGERTVKMHGGGQHSFSNGMEASLHSDRATYTLYPNAFLTYDEDGQYVKHIYMGGERVVSKIVHPMTFFVHSPKAAARADFEGYMPLSRYKAKKRLMEAAIDSSYQALGVPYLGVDRDSTSYPPSQLRMDNTSMKEDLIFFYHKDHLGSSNTILDSVGNILQWIEYLPYGEVMVDEQHSADYATPYKFNGKELDEETGLYYFGARYFDPKRVLWYSTDALQEEYPHISTYLYCANNPIIFKDHRGNYIVYHAKKNNYIYYKGFFYNERQRKKINDKWEITGNPVLVSNANSHSARTLNALKELDKSNDPEVRKVFATLSDIEDNYEVIINSTRKDNVTSPNGSESSIISLNYGLVDDHSENVDFNKIGVTDVELVAHEIKHAFDMKKHFNNRKVNKTVGVEGNEIEAVKFENILRKEKGHKLRTTYGGKDISTVLDK